MSHLEDPTSLPLEGVEQLQRRIDELSEELRKSRAFLVALLEHTPAVIFAKDRDGRIVISNGRFDTLFGGKQQVAGRTSAELFPSDPSRGATLAASDAEVLREGRTVEVEQVVGGSGGERHYYTTKFPVRGPGGEVEALGAVAFDVTALKQGAAERAALQARVIEAQEEVIRELATPLLPLAEGVVAMPIVGAVDESRAQRLLEALLQGIVAHQARIAILDITALRGVDATVTAALIRSAQAARLLGAQVVLTGVGPEVARLLSQREVDLRGIVTLSSLEAGIAYSFGPLADQPRSPVRRAVPP